VGWTTHGHSAVDVNIYASDPEQARPLQGNRENTDVGKFLREYLDLEDVVEELTRELREKGKVMGEGWMGKKVGEAVAANQGDHYSGDFKKRDALGGCGCVGGGGEEHVH
ncbi:MAG: hypothetical protein Q9207_008432, partial [Kuettlingeria erythrocarpa]